MTTNRERIADFVARQRMTFALVEDGHKSTDDLQILERNTGKILAFAPGAVTHLEDARDPVRGGRYLRIRLDDGRSFAMAGMGFVFAPSFVSSGPLADCPQTACMMDFEKLFHHLCHLVADEDQNRHKEAMRVIMVLLAYLDGARAMGLDIGPEEQKLEQQLSRLESRGQVPG